MKKIYRYDLPITQSCTELTMPVGAKILTVESQHNRPVMWAMVDPSAPSVKRHFSVVMTGAAVPGMDTHWTYIGTAQMEGGSYILHVFEVPA